MRITALEEYGLRCLITLGRRGPEGQLSISEIADREGLSVPYASKLLAILRKAGLVQAERGRTGGFSLARKPEAITLYEVLTTLGGPLIDPAHCQKFSGQLDECVHLDSCTVHEVLGGLAGYMRGFLSRTTLADMIAGLPRGLGEFEMARPEDADNERDQLRRELDKQLKATESK